MLQRAVLLAIIAAAHVLYVSAFVAPLSAASSFSSSSSSSSSISSTSISSRSFTPATARNAAASKGRARSTTALRMAADFYQTLGVARNADTKEIKSAYRKVR
eukprot:19661-Heterococcus_DN1.PRE.2